MTRGLGPLELAYKSSSAIGASHKPDLHLKWRALRLRETGEPCRKERRRVHNMKIKLVGVAGCCATARWNNAVHAWANRQHPRADRTEPQLAGGKNTAGRSRS
ncbi:hypothetical protein AAG570_003489 [Ranatra chinensis]|uniref:Uncharacterized protein n=1 Tax=Ranatra chinensis TaxID=642074 RepID=A0ABD0YLV5_9HEMI